MGHNHLHLQRRQDDSEGGLTTIDGVVYSVTYVTASPTFDGVIGGFTTLEPDTPTASAAQNTATSARASASNNVQASASIPNAATAGPDTTSSASLSLAPPTERPSASISSSASPSRASNAAASATSSTSSSSSSTSDPGMSTGAKAGIAIGIIAVIGLIAALALFCIGKKKKQQREQEARDVDEKKTFGATRNAINMQSSPAISTAGPAPRLSIRPMSRNLLGDFGFGGNRRSAGNMLNTVAESGPRSGSPGPQNRARTPVENPFADPKNPFADPEKAGPMGAPMGGPMAGPVRKAAPPMAPLAPPTAPNTDRIAFTGSWPTAPAGYDAATAPQLPPQPKPLAMPPKPTPAPIPAPLPTARSELDLPIMGATPSLAPSSPGMSGAAALGGAALATGAAAAVMASKKSEPRPEQKRPEPNEQPRQRPMEQPRPERNEAPREAPKDALPSPGPAPSPAFAAAGGPPGSPNPSVASSAASQQGGNVYRVLMDFVPSMDDELELKSGQLVRLLHEYDDGWVRPPPSIPLPLLTKIGPLHQARPLTPRCCPTNMPRCQAEQA
jgi:hypothetical protein